MHHEGGGVRRSYDPPHPQGPPANSYLLQVLAYGARLSTGTKSVRRKILSILHSSTHLNPNPDPNTKPKPSASPNTNPNPQLGFGLEIVLGSKVESNDVAKGSQEQNFEDLVQRNQHGCWGQTN